MMEPDIFPNISEGIILDILAPIKAPTIPLIPSTAPVLGITLPSLKWLSAPDMVVNTMAERATARAVCIGTPKPTVKRAMVIPAPPIPIKPIIIPIISMETNNIIITFYLIFYSI